MKVLLINDGSTSPNWGDRAAGVALRIMISQFGGEIIHTVTEDDLYRSTLDGDRPGPAPPGERDGRETVKLFVPPGLLKIRRRLLSDPDATTGNRLIPARWEDYERCAGVLVGHDPPWPTLLRSMREMDVAIINGTGSIKGNKVHPRTLLFLGFVIKSHFNKPTLMINHTADFDHPDLLRVAEEVYPLLDDVVFRDPVSMERCSSFCPCRSAADTAFWFKPAARETWVSVAARPTYFDFWPNVAGFDPREPYLCVGGSSIFGGRAGDLDRIVQGYVFLIERLRAQYEGQIVLTGSDEIDEVIFRPVAQRLDLPLIGVTTPIQQAYDILGNADAYIGGRWHPGIFALRGGTPVLALSSKTFKMGALVEMAGLSSATFDALELGEQADSIGRRLQAILEEGEELRSRLRDWAGEMAEKSWDNLAYLKRAEPGSPGESTLPA